MTIAQLKISHQAVGYFLSSKFGGIGSNAIILEFFFFMVPLIKWKNEPMQTFKESSL